ncbi:hypothetical protein [Cryptosporangium phraense]|uniref:Glycosyltransferase family 2 protein n=1 Tax=Cryptosporangium phraense TaxID=2593070 RepID=A0A545AR35_9ACTN|nr:hypothetical protein [Cryptosporangium phraense]TQS43778.1 hypothetical protein FL583_17240 [Cryptosporangium phraense]
MTMSLADRRTSNNHHGSHRDLLRPVPVSARAHARVDMIAVPTSRPVSYLAQAVHLAEQLDCVLLVLASGKSSVAEIERRYGDRLDGRLIAVEVPPGFARYTEMFRFETDEIAAGACTRPSDISVKRNVALMIARALGVHRLFFLDDDIVVPDHVDVYRAASAVGKQHWAVGFSIEGYPDNSVVCHAHRESGGLQDAFVGAGALMASPQRADGFFPNIYNEDWFYLLKCAADRAVATTGKAIQRPYDPFGTPSRARREEFGDLLAESLFWLLDLGGSVTDAGPEFWRQAIERRRLFIEEVRAAVEQMAAPSSQWRIEASLDAAVDAHREFTPRVCSWYLEAWMRDRLRWADRIESWRPGRTLGAVVRSLGLELGGSAESTLTFKAHRPVRTGLMPAPLADLSGQPLFGLASPGTMPASVDSAIAVGRVSRFRDAG